MCGIIGVLSSSQPAVYELYDGLINLQHRGQDAAGIVTYDGHFHTHKENGLVRDVFQPEHISRLKGSAGLGHTRYRTAGSFSAAEAQPFYVNSPYGISLIHNGNLVNTKDLAKEMFESDKRHLNTSSDSEILLNVFAHELSQYNATKINPDIVFASLKKVYTRISGGFAVICVIAGFGIVAFRDSHGIRPLIFGSRKHATGSDFILASESVALDALGYTIEKDLKPGEAICIQFDGTVTSDMCTEITSYTPCIFEFIYLARPDSMIDNISVYKARLRMGEKLGEKILRMLPDHKIDVVIPIPDSGRTAALEVANVLNTRYREGFIKNRYIGRTFIMPDQATRKRSVRQKLNVVELELKNKNVLLVDDSIVRGNTSKKIVEMCRQAGAKQVYFASAAPKVIHPNVYGIDMPTRGELIANGLNEEEIAQVIGADAVFYQDLDDLISATLAKGNPDIEGFDCSCFDGVYCTGDVSTEYLDELEASKQPSEKKSENPITLL